jgi:hypothetical protein
VDLQFAVSLVFLALTIWREARGEPRACKVAVGASILNRVDRPSWWGRDVLSVATMKWQYSSLTDPKDPQLTTWPAAADRSWAECLDVASGLLTDVLHTTTPGADSYYDISIAAPTWATPATFVGQVGRIRFHNLDHDVETV